MKKNTHTRKLWFNFQPGWTERPFHLISLFHSITFQPPIPFFPPLLICFATISPSYTVSLSLKYIFHQLKSTLFSLTCFQLVLLPISYHLPLIPSSFQFLLSFSPFDFPCLLAQISLPLPHYISLLLISHSVTFPHCFIPLYLHPPCLDLLCAYHCSVIQTSISLFHLL